MINRRDLVIVVAVIIIVVVVDPKYGPNRVNNNCDIANIEFLVGGGWTRVIFVSNLGAIHL